MSYIEREKIVQHLKDEIEGCKQPFGSRSSGKSIAYGAELGLKMAISYAKTLPTADVVEVRHGEWREVNDKYPRYVCTVCNHLFNNKNYNYCPCCGAKMDGERRGG